jgi:hypothetical protein
MVSSELPSSTCGDSPWLARVHRSSTWSRKQLPAPSISSGSSSSCSGRSDLAFRPGMAGRHQGAEVFVIDRLRDQSGLLDRQGQYQHVELAGLEPFQQDLGVALGNEQRHLRRQRLDPRHQGRQQPGSDGVDHAKAQRAGQRILAGGGDLGHPRRLGQRPLGLGHHVARRSGWQRTSPELRSNRATPSSSSSFLTATDSVGCETLHLSAARRSGAHGQARRCSGVRSGSWPVTVSPWIVEDARTTSGSSRP